MLNPELLLVRDFEFGHFDCYYCIDKILNYFLNAIFVPNDSVPVCFAKAFLRLSCLNLRLYSFIPFSDCLALII